MKRLLLDTSAYAVFMRGQADVVDALREADEIYVSATVLGEMLAGFMSGQRRRKNESELAQFLESPRVNLLDVDEGTAERYAVIFTSLREAGTPIPTNDLWIAASAMQYGLRLLTLDSHFQKVPQILIHFVSKT
ncbi:MAG TPA: type II toxin-antitoxin system VapC family toxin [Thermoanaerobaculia bacterium]|nr:type II toxin-antitoxin system VapC family toxin [Thermoanaerobaculia bacterium]